MILLKKVADTVNYLDKSRRNGNTIGFVPTMGALHEGHISLIRAAKKENLLVVCSIFVNPTQFNDPADFAKYPVTIEKDIALLEEAGCDLLFLPPATEIYPGGKPPDKKYDLGYLETVLEGKYRPGHFQGVCMVVERLLEIVRPDNLYLGQKDYQQCMVINKLIGIMHFEGLVKLTISPTLREESGLAMSSRNTRLTKEEKELAAAISRALLLIKTNLKQGDLQPLKEAAREMLLSKGFRIDYIEIAAAADLSVPLFWDGKQQLVALSAVFLNEVRLIDNMLLN